MYKAEQNVKQFSKNSIIFDITKNMNNTNMRNMFLTNMYEFKYDDSDKLLKTTHNKYHDTNLYNLLINATNDKYDILEREITPLMFDKIEYNCTKIINHINEMHLDIKVLERSINKQNTYFDRPYIEDIIEQTKNNNHIKYIINDTFD